MLDLVRRLARRVAPVLLIASAVLLAPGCGTAPPSTVYRVLAETARDPASRSPIASIIATDLHRDGIEIAATHRRDESTEVRALCYSHLIRVDRERAAAWLREALDDPAQSIQVTGAIHAKHVPEWDEATWRALWRVLESCTLGHVFERTAYALVERGGRPAADRIFDLTSARDPAWSDFMVRALALEPDERFRGAFERACQSTDHDRSLLGRRGLRALDTGSVAPQLDPREMTLGEWYAHWRDDTLRASPPEVLTLTEAFVEARNARVVIAGEMHAWGAGRATQIALLMELIHTRGLDLVAVFETPVLELQRPVIEVAEQYGIEVRTLEDEELGREGAVPVRDEVARDALAQMVVNEPDRNFIVFYGENHRRSLTEAVRDAGATCASVATHPMHGMLGSAMRAADGDIVGRAFRFADGSLFLASASYGVLAGCPALDAVDWGR